MNRNFGLDVLRATSIWLVLLQHLGIKITSLKPLQIGGVGVEVFFVLSGFLIGGILFKEIDRENSIATLKRFWIRRWFRILPLYYLVLIFKFTILDNSIGWNILYYVFFLQNNFYGVDFLAVSWSLVIEEWFYLFVPVFLMLLYHFLNSEKNIVITLVLFLIFENILRFLYVYFYDVPYQGVNGNFPFRFDTLFNGVMLAYLNYKKPSLFKKLQSPIVFTIGLLLLFLYLILFCSFSPKVDELLFPRTIGFYILSFSIALLIPFISCLKSIKRNHKIKAFIYSFVTTTSLLTYSLYLTHMFSFSAISSLQLTNVWITRLLSILLSYLIGYFLYNYFEKPILKLRDRITL